MEHQLSPIQTYYLFKSFVMMFIIQAVVVLITPIQLTDPIRYQILGLNLVVGIILGWPLYKQWYHIEFSYGTPGFMLRKGKNPPVTHNWNEFRQVSLARNEVGDFTVRLYNGEEPFEIPVSKLKLDPFRFRLEVAKYVADSASASQ